MHEYSLAQSLLSGLQEYLRQNPITGRVVKVHVRKGQLLTLSEWALKEAWRILTEGTELSGSELILESVPVKVRCHSCGYEGEARQLAEEGWHMVVPVLACPQCDSPVDIMEGRDLAIVGLTVEDDPHSTSSISGSVSAPEAYRSSRKNNRRKPPPWERTNKILGNG